MIQIRQATVSDASTLSVFCSLTFYDTYAPYNTEEDLFHYILNNFHDDVILKELNDPQVIFKIAETDGIPVAYYVLKKPENFDGNFEIHIARFYVHKIFHGSGIARRLFDDLRKTAKENHAKTISLCVWKENKRAVCFYEKCGFSISGESTFDWGTGKVDNDFIMTLEIN